MSNLEIELQDLRERNNELVKKVQYWKMTAAQKENEKLDLMKENNDLRLKLSRLRSGGAAHARKLDAEIQSASKQALSHLVQASSAVTRTVQLVKTYMQERQEMETTLPRWSSINNTPSSEKVHRVLPMLIGGQSIQPVVSLSRTMVNLNNIRTNRSPSNNQNRNYSEREALPIHMLQDLYIPLTRIDANGLPVNSMEVDPDTEEADVNNSSEDLGLDDSVEQSLHESQNMSDAEQFDETPRLEVVEEALEPEEEVQSSPKPRTENPLEGPSWMLDGPSKRNKYKGQVTLEPDSTTECDEAPDAARAAPAGAPGPSGDERRAYITSQADRLPPAVALACEFSPTVRRRKRRSSPPAAPRTPRTPHSPHSPHSPRPAARRNSNNGRILKVLVSKLRLEDEDASPPKRPSLSSSPARRLSDDLPLTRYVRERSPGAGRARTHSRERSPALRLSRDVPLFDAPSPNGATTSHVVISDTTGPVEAGGSGEPVATAHRVSKHESRVSRDVSCEPRHDSRGSQDSDSGSDVAAEGRTRRPRKAVTYKEKPLNRKMRR